MWGGLEGLFVGDFEGVDGTLLQGGVSLTARCIVGSLMVVQAAFDVIQLVDDVRPHAAAAAMVVVVASRTGRRVATRLGAVASLVAVCVCVAVVSGVLLRFQASVSGLCRQGRVALMARSGAAGWRSGHLGRRRVRHTLDFDG